MKAQHSSAFQVINPQETCIVYDDKSGKILHVHAVITLPGARDVMKQQQEEDARSFVQREISEKDKENLRVLWVSTEAAQFDEAQKVDLKKLSLVPLGKKSRQKKSKSGYKRKKS